MLYVALLVCFCSFLCVNAAPNKGKWDTWTKSIASGDSLLIDLPEQTQANATGVEVHIRNLDIAAPMSFSLQLIVPTNVVPSYVFAQNIPTDFTEDGPQVVMTHVVQMCHDSGSIPGDQVFFSFGSDEAPYESGQLEYKVTWSEMAVC
jgi:hypothetical protein